MVQAFLNRTCPWQKPFNISGLEGIRHVEPPARRERHFFSKKQKYCFVFHDVLSENYPLALDR